ncbi:hypothetical protein BJ741DRAFT_712980 [Chytriomyces cf. hyalinus JEL632]|nr:hypothetical protein BJ741DRAFT_712980 [Chytriomyces cf. hyalinus JEL632]
MTDTLTNYLENLHLNEDERPEHNHPRSNSSETSETGSRSDSGSDVGGETDDQDVTIHLVDIPFHARSIQIMHGTFDDYKVLIEDESLIRAKYFDFGSWDVSLGRRRTACNLDASFPRNKNPQPFKTSNPHFVVSLDALNLEDISNWALFLLTEYERGDTIKLTNDTVWTVRNNEATLLLIRKDNNHCGTLRNNHRELTIDQENEYLWHDGESWILNDLWTRRSYLKMAIAANVSLDNTENVGAWVDIDHALLG